MSDTRKEPSDEQKKVDDLSEENKVHTWLGSVPVDDEFIDNLGRKGS